MLINPWFFVALHKTKNKLTFLQMATEWSEYHGAFALLSAEKCTDKPVLEEAAKKIQHNIIDAFHQVRLIYYNLKGIFLSKKLHETCQEVGFTQPLRETFALLSTA